jgi:hypothetical protein
LSTSTDRWTYEISAINNNAEAKLIAGGRAIFYVGLYAQFQLPGTAEIGAKAQLYAEATLDIGATYGAEYELTKELWQGRTMRRIIQVGPVPIEL